jgi:AcrR family transcriptional regulator
MSKEKRTNMKPEARRNQLIDCAEALFFSKGFDGTTIQDVLDMAGVSKGGFYHHFKSKDELLFGVIYRSAKAVFADMQTIADDASASPLQKLHSFMHLEARHVQAHNLADYVEVFRVMNDPSSAVLLDQLRRYLRPRSTPFLAEILRSGVETGVFLVDDPETAAEMILYTAEFFHAAYSEALEARGTDSADAAGAHLQTVLDMQFLTIDRILGLPDKTTHFGWPDLVDAVMATRQPGDQG